MFERFTPYARRVVVFAEQEAATLRHDHIGGEHLLLGLTLLPGVPAARQLADNGVTHERASEAVARIPRLAASTLDPVDALLRELCDDVALRAGMVARMRRAQLFRMIVCTCTPPAGYKYTRSSVQPDLFLLPAHYRRETLNADGATFARAAVAT